MGNPKKIPYLDHTKCYGCKCCLFDCPVNAFDLIHPITKRGMRRTLPEFVRKEDCIGCGVCAKACPFDVIEMVDNPDYKAPAKKAAPAAAEGAAVAATAATADFDGDKEVKIYADNCRGCTMCAKACPVGAIKGEVKKPHEIAQDECIRCGACFETCKFNAIYQGDVLPEKPAPKKAAPAKAAAPAAAAAGAAAAGVELRTSANSEFDPDLAVRIFAEKCKGCTMCAKQCPAGAINGEVKKPHEIDQDACVRCGACFDTCKFGAIYQGDEVKGAGAPAADAAKAAAPAAAAGAAAAAPKKKAAPKKVEHAPLNRDFPLRIDPNACKACTMCARNCPEQCITGAPKTPHVINEELCSRCGTCWDVCKFNAIYNSDDPVPAYTGA